ncbi:hypothetical protein BD626DRAFT_494985 [Schizophyllum amplum]|uniref:NTF2 domain-containing protein n=1 Tax=Schizophyllum amplum TaxID=97359 RepID=A0A550CFS3_9AGAR|nr:hypothetical protein BD626DRAFT_494985 [Auriculariopsis ampla]
MSDATSTSSAAHRTVVPSDVGWQFVPQYYTFVNKEPERLHCFYTKRSTFIHGTEGEDGKACHGQQEIHQKITSIGFKDCKVFIHSVDAQSSADGGIIIQVIGEMSNQGEPWRKFVQTFFLAEQPNGYFVLNDIFRFLKEDTVEGDEAATDAQEEYQTAEYIPPPAEEPVREPTPPPARDPTPPPPPPAREPTPPPPPPRELTPPPAREPTPPPAPAPAAPEPEPTVKIPTPQPQPPAPAAAAPHTNGVKAAEKPATPAPPAAAPEPQKPAAPRSWATLAASNSKKWGAAVAQESRGTSEAAPPSPAPTTPRTPAQRLPPQQQQQQQQAPSQINSNQVFIKGVIEPISQPALINFLTTRYGKPKDTDIVRSKACAFVEFETVEAARKAIRDSATGGGMGQGTGVYIDVGGEQIRIVIETKKERGERPPSQPHSSTLQAGRGRGGFRGGDRGGSMRGRGGPPRGGPPK